MSSAAADTSDDVVTNLRLAHSGSGVGANRGHKPGLQASECEKSGQTAVLQGWQSVPITPDLIGRIGLMRGHDNTGIRTGHMAALDLDVPDAGIMLKMVGLADLNLGPTPLVRIGKPPKALRCYRNATPLAKLETPEHFLPDGTKLQIEAMGAGQQVVAFGTHPTTMAPYTWLAGSPADTTGRCPARRNQSPSHCLPCRNGGTIPPSWRPDQGRD